MYLDGSGTPRDYDIARQWFAKAASQGSAAAMTAIGSMYRDAKGSRRDYKAAMEWYLRAAAAKNWTAAYNIGTLYRCGWGVEEDFAQAMAWFRKGANNGHARSMFGIATLHRRGEGVMRRSTPATGPEGLCARPAGRRHGHHAIAHWGASRKRRWLVLTIDRGRTR
jgi:TPR repeat protein